MFLRFSGITEKDLVGVKTTIRDVQAVLLSMFSSDTILCGHSLESDLKALKVEEILNFTLMNNSQSLESCNDIFLSLFSVDSLLCRRYQHCVSLDDITCF